MKAVGVTVVGVGMRGPKSGMVGLGRDGWGFGGSYGLAGYTVSARKRHPRRRRGSMGGVVKVCGCGLVCVDGWWIKGPALDSRFRRE